MRRISVLVPALLAFAMAASSDETPKEKARAISPWSSLIWQRRPVRQDEPLREENISDSEVLQIEGVMKELYPGSIVYISAVTSSCPCEDGPNCEDQVWSVATLASVSNELALSRIDGEWQVGPLQEWWLDRDRIQELYYVSWNQPGSDKGISLDEYRKRITEHNLAYPYCEPDQRETGR